MSTCQLTLVTKSLQTKAFILLCHQDEQGEVHLSPAVPPRCPCASMLCSAKVHRVAKLSLKGRKTFYSEEKHTGLRSQLQSQGWILKPFPIALAWHLYSWQNVLKTQWWGPRTLFLIHDQVSVSIHTDDKNKSMLFDNIVSYVSRRHNWMEQENNFISTRSEGPFQSSGKCGRRRVWRVCLGRDGKKKGPKAHGQRDTEGSCSQQQMKFWTLREQSW